MPGYVISFLDMGSRTNAFIPAGLAINLKKESKKRISLLDFSSFPVMGKMKILFNLTEDKNITSLLPIIEQLDARLIEGYFVSHSSGVDLMSGCLKRDDLSPIKPGQMLKIMELLPKIYDYTLINLDNNLDENALSLLDSSNLIVLLINPDYFSLGSAKQMIDFLYSFHYAPQLIKIVLNTDNLEAKLSLPKIEDYLKNEIFYEISSNAGVSINRGIDCILENCDGVFCNTLNGLVKELLNENIFTSVSIGKRKKSLLGSDIDYAVRDTEKNIHKNGLDACGETVPATNEINELKNHIHKRLVKEMDSKGFDFNDTGNNESVKIREEIRQMVERLLNEDGNLVIDRNRRENIILELMDDILGLGHLEKFLKDPSISEIMVNNKDKVYIEQNGKIKLTDVKFANDQQIFTIIERIVAPIGRRIDESSPLVDARLKDGSRVNAIIPPLALDGPTITIRKFKEKKLSPQDLINFGSLTREMMEFIRVCVKLRKNIIISGGTGSGKTTFLNVVSSFIPSDERIITIEDSAELKLPQEHVVRLESRPSNIEGEGEIPIRQLVINCLRMRPDRIIIGECRGGEAIDMLQAMNTGHEGSLTTLHANTPRDAVARLETMVLMAGIELPLRAIREQIASSIDIIIQQSRFSDGTRKVTQISEITGLEENIIKMADIFKFVQKGIDEQGNICGDFKSMNIVPSFMEDANSKGYSFDANIFK